MQECEGPGYMTVFDIGAARVHNLGETIGRGLFGTSADHRYHTWVSQLNASRPIIKVRIILY